MTTEVINYNDIDLTVYGTYVPPIEAVYHPVDAARPGERSDFDILSVSFDADNEGDMVDVAEIYESLDCIEEIRELVINEIEK